MAGVQISVFTQLYWLLKALLILLLSDELNVVQLGGLQSVPGCLNRTALTSISLVGPQGTCHAVSPASGTLFYRLLRCRDHRHTPARKRLSQTHSSQSITDPHKSQPCTHETSASHQEPFQ